MGGWRRCREWMRERKRRKEGAEGANEEDTGQRSVSHRKRPRDYGMRGGMSDAARCKAQRSTLQQPMQRGAMANAPHCVSKPEEPPWDEEHRKPPHAPAPASAKNAHRLSARCDLHLCIVPCTLVCRVSPHSHRATWACFCQRTGKKETQQYCSASRRIEAYISIRWFRTAVLLRFQGQHAILAESDHPDLSYQPAALA